MKQASDVAVRFLVYGEALSPVFPSVYVNPAARLAAAGLDCGIVVLGSLGEFVKPRLSRRWRELTSGLDPSFRNNVVRLPTTPKRSRWPLWDTLLVWSHARRLARSGTGLILHCGGSYAACVGIAVRQDVPGVRVVYHSWGAEAAEILDGLGDQASPEVRRRAQAADGYQRRAMHGADFVVTVSSRMTEWARREFGVEDGRMLAVPCFVDTARFFDGAAERDGMRRRLGFGDEPVIAYCGSMLSWQLPPRSLEVLRAARRLNPKVRFLGITMHPQSLRIRLEEEGFPAEQAMIVSVPHGEVPRYLAAADLGIIGRAPSLVNEVASPLKFGEYLASGTPVFLNEGIGDFSGLVEAEALGFTTPLGAPPELIEHKLAAFWAEYEWDRARFRQRCRDFARRELDIDRHVERLTDLYSRLAPSTGLRSQRVPAS